MGKYVVLYTGLPADDADIKAVEAAWTRWFQELGSAVIDAGHPFGSSKTVATDGSVKDGESLNLTGYSILAAGSLNAAVEMVKKCPGLATAVITVYETVQSDQE